MSLSPNERLYQSFRVLTDFWIDLFTVIMLFRVTRDVGTAKRHGRDRNIIIDILKTRRANGAYVCRIIRRE